MERGQETELLTPPGLSDGSGAACLPLALTFSGFATGRAHPLSEAAQDSTPRPVPSLLSEQLSGPL